jgi:hypothetical protein
MPKPEGSQDALGKNIASGFGDDDDGDDQDDASTSDDDDDDDDPDDADADDKDAASGQSDQDDKGKPDDKKAKKGDTVTLTRDELKELIREQADEAVQTAVNGVKSAKDKQLESQRKEHQAALDKAQDRYREGVLNGTANEADRARLKEAWKLDDERTELDREREEVGSAIRAHRATTLADEHKQIGITVDELLACDSQAEQDALIARKSGEFWKDVVSGKRKLSDDLLPNLNGENGKGDQKGKKRPAGASAKSDVGGGGSPAGVSKGGEKVTTLEGLGASLVTDGMFAGVTVAPRKKAR